MKFLADDPVFMGKDVDTDGGVTGSITYLGWYKLN